ncbi:HAMP domain-containing protein [Spirochaeta isovalerica]|uniref:HAMP domain-containing protein n=1 Tax=Spirochaeta isovalerica TaxID=150 RepID=A0A841R9F4_9SPIO|nr:hypothetical protein [Spirochaeta isovalerica]MBB6479991.1 HAMP domain-containing protein [Spirochaeta isovalerica]
MGVVVNKTEEYADSRIERERQEIREHILAFLLSSILIFFFLQIFQKNIFAPLDRLKNAMLLISRKNAESDVPYINIKNEIGDIARAVNEFRINIIKLDKANFALEKTSADKENLIAALETRIKEINELQELIPICSYCKNVRNDKGYYEEIESYIAKHSSVDFSHTICPDCLRKYYPDSPKNCKGRSVRNLRVNRNINAFFLFSCCHFPLVS